jgi:hypothetical protein
MSAFVDECRREWKRLGVPDSLAEEMASELEADLDEAAAEGVAAPEILGESDPRRFAETWAAARGLVSDQARPARRRTWLIVAAAAAVVLLIGGLTTLALVTTETQRANATTVPVPMFVGGKESVMIRLLKSTGLRPEIARVSWGRAGYVLAQHPDPGTRVARGSVVWLKVGGG